MAIDQKAARAPADEGHARWRDAHEIQALRDTIRVYRSGATALAADVTELRAEVQRLRSALRVEVQALGNATDPERLGLEIEAAPPRDLSIVERLSERWGTEQVASGRTTVWAQLAPTSSG